MTFLSKLQQARTLAALDRLAVAHRGWTLAERRCYERRVRELGGAAQA